MNQYKLLTYHCMHFKFKYLTYMLFIFSLILTMASCAKDSDLFYTAVLPEEEIVITEEEESTEASPATMDEVWEELF